MPSPYIGRTAEIHTILAAKVERLRHTGNPPLRLLFTGEPGTGKTDLAKRLARQLAGHELGVESFNGIDVGVSTVRDWRHGFFTPSLFSDWRVIVIDEADRISPDAQVLMLTLLDTMPAYRAIIATTNRATNDLPERLQTRFQQWEFQPIPQAEIEALVRRRYPMLAPQAIAMISTGAAGNVRCALEDAEKAADALAARR